MGSFNVGCGISNLSINERDRVGFLFLAPNPLKQYAKERSKGQSIKIYCDEDYIPYLPPVYGTYGDYGYVKNVESSITTDLLEETFGVPVAELIKMISIDREVYYDGGPIYQHFILPEHKFVETFRMPEDEIFKNLGFSHIQDNTYQFKDRFLVKVSAHLYQISEMVDGELVSLYKPFTQSSWYQTVDTFARLTGYYPGIAEENWLRVKEINSLSGMYFLPEPFEAVQEATKDDYFVAEARKSFPNHWNEFLEKLASIEGWDYPTTWSIPAVEFLRRQVGFATPNRDFGLFSQYKDAAGISEIYQISQLYSAFTSVNRMFQPSYNGEQMGNTEASIALTEASLGILKKRQKEYE